MNYFKVILVLLLATASSFGAFAQTLDRSVVSTEGNYVSTPSLSLEFTLGEVAIGYYNNSSISLSQGFNQSDTATNQTDLTESNLGHRFVLFPNPAKDNIVVTSSLPATLDIIDATGKTVVRDLTCLANQALDIPIEDLEAGVYFVRLHTASGSSLKKWVKL